MSPYQEAIEHLKNLIQLLNSNGIVVEDSEEFVREAIKRLGSIT